jgi:hypothetical protein
VAYTVPTTQTDGNVVGQSDWNTDLVENIKHLADPPRVSAYRSSDLSVAYTTETIVPLNAETYDTDSMHSTSVDTGRLAATTAGLYQVRLRVFFEASTGGYRQARIYLNGVGVDLIDEATNDSPSASTTTSLLCEVEQFLDVGEYVEASCYQSRGSTGTLNLLGSGSRLTRFTARWVAVS